MSANLIVIEICPDARDNINYSGRPIPQQYFGYIFNLFAVHLPYNMQGEIRHLLYRAGKYAQNYGQEWHCLLTKQKSTT